LSRLATASSYANEQIDAVTQEMVSRPHQLRAEGWVAR
jgi:hypothetical protein